MAYQRSSNDINNLSSGRTERPGVGLGAKTYGQGTCKCGATFLKRAWNQKLCDGCISKRMSKRLDSF